MGAEIADFIGSIDVAINKLAGSWSWGQDTATNLPFDLNATGGPDQFLFVVPVILGAYTPVSGQTLNKHL